MTTKLVDNVIKNSKLETRPYQHRICSTVTKMMLEQGLGSIMIESPTGSGKTCMAQIISSVIQQNQNIGIAWVAMRRNLLQQAERARKEFNLPVDMEYVSMFARDLPTTDKTGRKIDLVIVDECQHDATDSMANLYQVIRPKLILGMSATPHRTDRAKLCFEHTVRDAGIYQLIQQGYLANYHLYAVESWTPEIVANTYLQDPNRFGKSAFYFRTIEEATECTNRLRAGGIPTELVTGSSDRDTQLRKFETGEVKALVNMYVLTEGFDSPDLQTVFVRDSSRSPTVQMAGRVFRKHPSIPFKQVVQSRNTKWPFVRTAKPVQSFSWEHNSWRSYTLSPAINRVMLKTSVSLMHTNVQMPDIILKHQHKRRYLTN